VYGSLFSLGGITGSVYIMLSGVKCMMTCISSNIVFYGVSFVVHSSSDMVRIVIVSGFLLRQGGPSVWLFVCFLCCVGGHIQYSAIYV
jgi:hypothetical protein